MNKQYFTPNELRIFDELAEIKRLLIGNSAALQPQPESDSKMRTPKYVCVKYDISRTTLEKYFRNGWLTKISISPESSKVYIAESELLRVFNASAK